MALQHYETVFVILTYRNTNDIVECLESIHKTYKSVKAVIVNSYYDVDSEKQIFDVANIYQCDYFSVENKGYSYGNNVGIDYCKNNYDFDFLVICNPDIVIEKNNFEYRKWIGKNAVFAPIIHNSNGKMQNPYWVIDNKISEFLIYLGYKSKNRIIMYFGIGVNKIIREFTNITFAMHKKKKLKKIYAAHGSFTLFTKNALEIINPLYDNVMFLFAEEAYTARLYKKNNIPVFFIKDIKVLHKEDGSMKLAKIDESSELRKSVLYYYEKLKKK